LTQTTQYRAVVQSGSCTEANSAEATITVDVASVGGTITGATICSGSTANLSLTSNVGNVVKWQSSANGSTGWTDIVNTTTSYITPALSATTYYRAVVKNGVCDEAYSSVAEVTVSSQPEATISYDAPYYCTSLTTPQAVTQTGVSGGTYSQTGGVGTLTLNTTTGAITPSTSGAGTYEVTYYIAASGGCAALTEKANVTISALPTETLTAPAAFCEGTLASEPTKSITGYTITWYTTSAGTIAGTAPTVASLTAAGSPYTFYYKVEDNTTHCVSAVHNYAVTVNAIPTETLTAPAAFCEGTLATEPNKTIAGYTITW
jgi:hypothetical protein